MIVNGIRRILEDRGLLSKITSLYMSVEGIVVNTQHSDSIFAALSNQPHLEVSKQHYGFLINIKKTNYTCNNCGSKEFVSQIIEQYESYIDPTSSKVLLAGRPFKRSSITICAICAEPKDDLLISKKPSIARGTS